MTYYDIHTHREPERGVKAIRNLMNPDTLATELEQEGLYSAGLHPWHLHPDHWQEDIAEIRKHMHNPRLVAIGEAGLDRLTDLPLELQKSVFVETVRLSEEAKKPLIIHAVRTHAEITLLHAQLKPTQAWIIHGFNNRNTIGHGILNQGIHLSFGAAILNEGSPAAKMLAETPQDRFFLESDDAQVPMKELYHRAALLTGKDIETMVSHIEERFNRMFTHG